MPELPEVETVCRGLSEALLGTHILKLDQRRKDLRIPFPKDLPKRLEGRKIRSIERRAKYILITLDKDETLILHLGMSGRLVIAPENTRPAKHDHLIFHCTNGKVVTFNDPRRFGLCDLVKTKTREESKHFKHLGVEPLEKEFDATYLASHLKNKKMAIKLAIMDQRLVVGVGNIYASEALFYAGIKPTRPASKLTHDEITKLLKAIKKVLKAAIAAGGSTLRDYVTADGALGYFQNQHAVYDRTHGPCKGCTCDLKKTGGVQRITQGGRSSFYCPTRQS